MEKLTRIKEELEKVLENKGERTEIEINKCIKGIEIKSRGFWDSDFKKINNIISQEEMLIYINVRKNNVCITIHW